MLPSWFLLQLQNLGISEEDWNRAGVKHQGEKTKPSFGTSAVPRGPLMLAECQ